MLNGRQEVSAIFKAQPANFIPSADNRFLPHRRSVGLPLENKLHAGGNNQAVFRFPCQNACGMCVGQDSQVAPRVVRRVVCLNINKLEM